MVVAKKSTEFHILYQIQKIQDLLLSLAIKTTVCSRRPSYCRPKNMYVFQHIDTYRWSEHTHKQPGPHISLKWPSGGALYLIESPVLPVTHSPRVGSGGGGWGTGRAVGEDVGNSSFFLPLLQIPKHASRHRSRCLARAGDTVTSTMTAIWLVSSGAMPLSTS